MKRLFLILLTAFSLITPDKASAQKFGVNAGYVYGTFIPRITEDRSYFEQFEQFQNTFKRLHFPDACKALYKNKRQTFYPLWSRHMEI